MKKIIIIIGIIFVLILSGIIYYDLLKKSECKEKICPIDCGFSSNHEDDLKKCEIENTNIIKYFK